MTPVVTVGASTEAARGGGERIPLLARQAIVDGAMRTVGYELLYRGRRAQDGRPVDELSASATVMWNAWLVHGREALAGPLPLWINCTRELLLEPERLPIAPGEAVLEVLEHVEVDDELVTALRRLRGDGHRIALDDFVPGSAAEALVDVAHVVKLDLRTLGEDVLAAEAARLHARGKEVVAEKVELREEFDRLLSNGLRSFQGWFYEQPVVVSGRSVPAATVGTVRRCARLLEAGDDLDAVTAVVRDDPVLAFRLTRLANSAFYGGMRPIESVPEALVRLGARAARRWLLLLSVSELGEKGHPALAVGVQRAHLCESLAVDHPADVRDRAFLCGLLSVLESLVGPMPELLAQVEVGPRIEAALLHGTGVEGAVLADAIRLQRADGAVSADGDLAGIAAASALAYAESSLAELGTSER